MSSLPWWIVGGWTARHHRGLREDGAAKPHLRAPARRQNNFPTLMANRFILTLAFARCIPTIAPAAKGVARRVCRFCWVQRRRLRGRSRVDRNSECSNENRSNTSFACVPIQICDSTTFEQTSSSQSGRDVIQKRSSQVGGEDGVTQCVKVQHAVRESSTRSAWEFNTPLCVVFTLAIT